MTSDWRRQSTKGKVTDLPKGTYLAGRAFLLEVENRNERMRVAEGITNAGGIIIDSYDEKNPLAVISDHSMASRLEKDHEVHHLTERTIKALPALLREAVRRKIKVRTPDRFLRQLVAANEKQKKASSATNSHSTIRARPTAHTQPPERAPAPPVAHRPVTDPTPPPKKKVEEKAYLRIDCPGKRPEVRSVDKSTFGILYSGKEAGHSVFKGADAQLMQKRDRDFALFCSKSYLPSKKAFKLDEKENYCQFCTANFIGERKEHERTEEHRLKARSQGLVPTVERILMNVQLRNDRRALSDQKRSEFRKEVERCEEASKRAAVEYEYGENEFRVKWEELRKKEEPPKIEISPRRRQKRIRYSPAGEH